MKEKHKFVIPYFIGRKFEIIYRPTMISMIDSKKIFPARLLVYKCRNNPYKGCTYNSHLLFGISLGKIKYENNITGLD